MIRYRIQVRYPSSYVVYVTDRGVPYHAGAGGQPADHPDHTVFEAEDEDHMQAFVEFVARQRRLFKLPDGTVTAVRDTSGKPRVVVMDAHDREITVSDDHIEAALAKVREGIERKIAKHGRMPWTRHLAAGIILEERKELEDELPNDDDPQGFVDEANDLAVCGLWVIASQLAGAIES